ncbi:MAG: hypothetical protein ABIK92_06525 [Pseudomonadota bacterium]
MDDFMNDDCFDDGDFEYDDSPDFEEQDCMTNHDTIDIGWENIAMFGALSEQIAEEERERLRIEKDFTSDDDQEDIY